MATAAKVRQTDHGGGHRQRRTGRAHPRPVETRPWRDEAYERGIAKLEEEVRRTGKPAGVGEEICDE